MRPIPGHPNYPATSEGQVLSKETGEPLKPRRHHRTGHLRVRLYGDHLPEVVVKVRGKLKIRRFVDVYLHVLICLAFHGPPPFDGAIVLHWDDNPENNRPENLRWGSYEENQADRARNTARNAPLDAPDVSNSQPLDDDGFDWSAGDFIPSSPLYAPSAVEVCA